VGDGVSKNLPEYIEIKRLFEDCRSCAAFVRPPATAYQDSPDRTITNQESQIANLAEWRARQDSNLRPPA
jgi:hypothetical protein